VCVARPLVQPWQWREIEPLEQKRGNRLTTNPYSLTNSSQITEDNKELLDPDHPGGASMFLTQQAVGFII